MQEIKFSIVLIITFIILSYIIQVYLIRTKPTILFAIFEIIYLTSTILFMELFDKIGKIMSEKGMDLDFGHASILMLELWFGCIIIGLIFIGLAISRRIAIVKT